MKIYVIEMSETFQKRLGYASKLDRDDLHLDKLMAHGEERAMEFLENPEAMRFDPRC